MLEVADVDLLTEAGLVVSDQNFNAKTTKLKTRLLYMQSKCAHAAADRHVN